MNLIFINDCAVDGCYKKNQKGKQMCDTHQQQYDAGVRLTAFYGKTVQKKPSQKIITDDRGRLKRPAL